MKVNSRKRRGGVALYIDRDWPVVGGQSGLEFEVGEKFARFRQ